MIDCLTPPQQRRLIASVVVVNAEGAILMGRKATGRPPYPDTWHIPGGGVEPGEFCHQTACREVREETGAEVTNLRALRFDEDVGQRSNGDPVHYIFLVYYAEYAGGDLRPGSDLVELRWIEHNELQTLADEAQLTPPSIKLFRNLNWIR